MNAGRTCQVSLYILTPEGALAPHLCGKPVPCGTTMPVCCRCLGFLGHLCAATDTGVQRALAIVGAAYAKEARS